MENKPLDLSAIEAQHIHVVLASYTEGANDSLDKVAGDAALAKKVLFDDAVYGALAGGYRETSVTGGVVAALSSSGSIHLALAGSWEQAGPTKNIIPIVYYRKKNVAHVGGSGTNGIKEWNPLIGAELTSGALVAGRTYKIVDFITGDDFANVGAASNADNVVFVATGTTPTTWTNSSILQALPVIEIDNTAGAYGTTVTDYEVVLVGDLPGFLESLDMGGINLPYTKQNIKSVGYKNPTMVRFQNDGEEITGSMTFWEAMNAIFNDTTLHNAPGEDFLKAVYGAAWSEGQANQLGYQANPVAISVIVFGNMKMADDNNVGALYCVELRLYGAQLNAIGNLQNVSGGATEPVKRQFQFTAKQLWHRVRRVVAE